VQLAARLQLVGKHVQQDLRIRVRVQVAHLRFEQLVAQGVGVREVAVVRHGDAVGRIDVERLRIRRATGAGGRIAHVSDTDTSEEALHVVLAEHVANQALVLALVKTIMAAGHDARRVLAAVLQHRERVVQLRRHGAAHDHTGEATHQLSAPPGAVTA
jgi:hypothetical protein